MSASLKLLFALAIVCFGVWLAPVSAEKPESSIYLWTKPNVYAEGVYLDQENIVVRQTDDGLPFFMVTENGGNSWRVVKTPNASKKSAWTLVPASTSKWLLIDYDHCWTSSDRGIHWDPLKASFLLGWRSSALALVQLIQGGVLWWNDQSVLPNSISLDGREFYSFRSVSTIDAHNVVASVAFEEGNSGLGYALVSSDNYGRNWHWLVKESQFNSTRGGQFAVDHVFFRTFVRGWISSDNDEGIDKTVDGGKSWSSIITPDRVVVSMYFKNDNEGRIIGGSTGKMYETNDGGRGWRVMKKGEILSSTFLDYFNEDKVDRWNDFAVYRVILANSSNQ